MADLTTRPVETGSEQAATPGPAPASAQGTGAAGADARTLRRVTRAEQERLSADAEVERRGRAARLDLELREQRRAADRREREAADQQKQARRERRRNRRAARRARLHAAAPKWAERALLVLPIVFPMAVAWVGQIRFAMTVMGWPLPAAVVFAAGFELSTAYVARLDWLSRAAGDTALLFRCATWGFAAGAATMNYWHAAGPGFTPNGEAVSYGLMSVTGVLLWELLSTYRHRTALRAEGKLPAARPRFGLARWIWFNKLTRVAWLLTLRDGYTTTDLAWRAALVAVDRYGSTRDARKAVRAGRPVPGPKPNDIQERDAVHDTADHRDARHGEHNRDIQTRPEDRDATDRDLDRDDPTRDGWVRCDNRDNAERDTPRGQQPDHPRDAGRPTNSRNGEPSTGHTGPSPADRNEANAAVPAFNPDHGDNRSLALADQAAGDENDRGESNSDEPGTSRDHGTRQHPGEPAVSAKMLDYARQRLAEGVRITGADLDRQFGTRDYGRKVLRRLATESQATGA